MPRAALVAAAAMIAVCPPIDQARADISVVTSIKPVHSLAAAVMAGIDEPFLIVEAAGSPHAYTMRPSEARALERADVVFWTGPELETFLTKPLNALGEGARVVSLAKVDGVTLLQTREAGRWEGHGERAYDHDHAGEHGHDNAGGRAGYGVEDMHIWLDPANAKAMVRAMTAELTAADPDHAVLYRTNAEELSSRIDALDREIAAKLAPISDVPYIVFHDAYQYLERYYGLNAVGAIAVLPGRNPGAKRLYEIRQQILDLGAVCIFAEPQFEPALVATVTEGTGARHDVLDPLGADIAPGPDAYFTLMRNLAQNLESCLAASG